MHNPFLFPVTTEGIDAGSMPMPTGRFECIQAAYAIEDAKDRLLALRQTKAICPHVLAKGNVFLDWLMDEIRQRCFEPHLDAMDSGDRRQITVLMSFNSKLLKQPSPEMVHSVGKIIKMFAPRDVRSN
jgi:hypothetical protein